MGVFGLDAAGFRFVGMVRMLRPRAVAAPDSAPGYRHAVDERFETDLRAGYPDDASGVVLGSPMLDGEVLDRVRVRLPLSTVNRDGLVAGATGTGKPKTLQVIAG